MASLAAWAYFLPLSKVHKGITVLGLSCLLLSNRAGVSFGQIRLQVLDWDRAALRSWIQKPGG